MYVNDGSPDETENKSEMAQKRFRFKYLYKKMVV
jgi:hypothetical protein